MNQGSQTMEELLSFFRERMAIEEDYSRRMASLSKRFNIKGIYETGQLSETFQVLKEETENIARSHLNESKKIKFNVYDKVESFLSSFNGKKKQIETTIENLVTTKKMLFQNVLKLKDRYKTETSKLNSYIAQEELLLGKESEKNRDKIYKQQTVVSEIRSDYQINCSKLEELNNYWIQEWKNSTGILQFMESERIEFLVKQIWEYSNLISTSCVNDDLSCENLRKSLELCDTLKDINHFVLKFQTGTQIYQTPRFVDFVNNGNIEDASNGVIINQPDTRSTSASTRMSSHHSQHTLQPMRSLDPHSMSGQQNQQQQQQQQQHHHQVQHVLKTMNHSITSNSRRRPPSEDGQTSISNPSTNLSSNQSSNLRRQESSYSNPTSVSSFSESINNELRSSQNWNSPSRRRSRNSDILTSKKSSVLSRRSFVLENSKPAENHQYIDLTDEDPLRATLEDLKIGGNGDMNKFKEYISHSRSNGSKYSANEDQFRSSISSSKTNNTTIIRPKSMLLPDSEPMISPSKRQQASKRASFYSGVRSTSRSSINLQGKLQSNGYPNVTSTGRRILKICKALFDFQATIDGELSFKEGDILFVIHTQEDGWWECENSRTGKQGLAPYNYVEQV